MPAQPPSIRMMGSKQGGGGLWRCGAGAGVEDGSNQNSDWSVRSKAQQQVASAEMPTARAIAFDPPWCVFVSDVDEQLARPLVAASFRLCLLIIIYAPISGVCHQKKRTAPTHTHTLYCIHRADYSLGFASQANYHWWGPPAGKREACLAFFPLFFSS